MSIQIEKNIPIPNRRRSTGLSEAMRKMKVGDSVIVSSFAIAYVVARHVNIEVTCRKVDGKIRAWRTK